MLHFTSVNFTGKVKATSCVSRSIAIQKRRNRFSAILRSSVSEKRTTRWRLSSSRVCICTQLYGHLIDTIQTPLPTSRGNPKASDLHWCPQMIPISEILVLVSPSKLTSVSTSWTTARTTSSSFVSCLITHILACLANQRVQVHYLRVPAMPFAGPLVVAMLYLLQ